MSNGPPVNFVVETNSQKQKKAATFKVKKLIDSVDASKLSGNAYRVNTSNIQLVLDKYFTRK